MIRVIKFLRSKWFDLFPVAIMMTVAMAQGPLYWLAGVRNNYMAFCFSNKTPNEVRNFRK